MEGLALVVAGQVGGVDGHGALERGGVAHVGDPAVVGDVEPLVAVGGPGVGALHTPDQVAPAGRRRGPESEGAVHVEPGSEGVAPLAEFREGVGCAAVHVARLGAHEGGALECGQPVGADAPLVVHGQLEGTRTTQPQQAEALAKRGVHLGPHHHAQLRCTAESPGFHVPALAREQRVARGRHGAEVGKGGAGGERGTAVGRKPEQLRDPAQRDRLELGRPRASSPGRRRSDPRPLRGPRRRRRPGAPRP